MTMTWTMQSPQRQVESLDVPWAMLMFGGVPRARPRPAEQLHRWPWCSLRQHPQLSTLQFPRVLHRTTITRQLRIRARARALTRTQIESCMGMEAWRIEAFTNSTSTVQANSGENSPRFSIPNDWRCGGLGHKRPTLLKPSPIRLRRYRQIPGRTLPGSPVTIGGVVGLAINATLCCTEFGCGVVGSAINAPLCCAAFVWQDGGVVETVWLASP
mmetsp:Transcript_81934/g.264490  ORF Transcript_81934/g.264490 Transcript_81934/m.264490 type:complete len:214 (+) Transcript_81934:1795-2436(+)